MYLEIFVADFAVFRVFLGISQDFTEIPEFRGSATARNIRSPESWYQNLVWLGRHQNKGFRLLCPFFSLRPHSARFAHGLYFHLAPPGSLFTGYNGKGGTHGYSLSWSFIFLFSCPYLPCISQQLLLHNFFCKMSYTDLRNVLNLLPIAHLNASQKSCLFSLSLLIVSSPSL